MRKYVGPILVGLGIFLLILGALAKWYAYPKVAVVPLDQVSAPPSDAIPDPTNPPTVSRAIDASVLSLAEGGKVITTDLTSTRITIGQVDDAEELSDKTGRDLAIYATFSYNEDTEGRVLSGTYDRVTFDRNTGESYQCPAEYVDLCDEKTASAKVDPEATDVLGNQDDLSFVHTGEGDFPGFQGQYFKMPFNAQKTTYQWWDGDLLAATDAVYEGTDTLDGLAVYKYVQTIEPTKTGTQEIPADIADIDAEGNVTVDQIYSNIRTLWIEPETGVLIKGQEQQDNYFEYQGQRVLTTTTALIAYDDATVQDNVDTYKPLAFELKLIRVWVPLVGLGLGAILLVLGIALTLRRRDEPGASSQNDDTTVLTHS